MSNFTDARLPLDPTQAALLAELLALPNRPGTNWFVTKDAGSFFLDEVIPGSVTVTNGLSYIGSDIGLGGLLIQDTDIDGGGIYNFSLTDTSFIVSGFAGDCLVQFGGTNITIGAVLALQSDGNYTQSISSFDVNGVNNILVENDRIFLGNTSNTFFRIDYTTGNVYITYTDKFNITGVQNDNGLSGVLVIDPSGGDLYYRDSTTFDDHLVLASLTDTVPGSLFDKLVAGTNVSLTLNAGPSETITIDVTGTGASYYQVFQDNGSNLTQRNNANFISHFTLTDDVGNNATTIELNIPAVEADLDLSAIAGLLNLASQVTGILSVSNGGTGLSTVSQGDIFYGSTSNVISRLAKNTSATRYLSNSGTNNNPAWSQVDLTNGVTGVLPTTNGGDAFTVKATGTDTTPDFLDDKIEIISSDSSITVTKTISSGNEKISYDLSTLISGLSEQILGGVTPSGTGDDTDVIACTSSLDGSIVIVAYTNSSNNGILYRFEKDAGTGFYKFTNTANTLSKIKSGAFGIVIEGNYVYALFDNGANNLACTRFDIADLDNATAMTVPVIATVGSNFASFSDGAGHIYTNFTSTTYRQLTISGTTLTAGSNITGGLANTQGAYFDGTNVFMIDDVGTVNSYTYTIGGSFTLVDTNTFMQAGLLFYYTKYVGFGNVSATNFHICYASQVRSYTGTNNQVKEIAIIKPFTKPI